MYVEKLFEVVPGIGVGTSGAGGLLIMGGSTSTVAVVFKGVPAGGFSTNTARGAAKSGGGSSGNEGVWSGFN